MNTKSLCKLVVIAILSAFVLTSCNKDKETEENAPLQGSFSCKIDGELFTATSFNNTVIGDATGKRLDIRATDASGKQVIVTINDLDVIGTDFSHVGDSVFVDIYENSPLGLATLGTIITDDSFVMSMGLDGGKEAGFAILTSSDLSSKKISGKFEFLLDDFKNDKTISVTEGTFTDVVYTQK